MDAYLENAVGNTPLLRLEHIVPSGCGNVWIKLESGNPTGSYKDRMAVSVIGRALERGDVTPGDRVVEYTGGSTGTALAFVAARTGLQMLAVSSDAFAESKISAMRAYGAEVIIEPSEQGNITPELIARMRDRAYALGAQPGSFYADQFGSSDVRAGYLPMGTEIALQIDTEIDVLCAGVGTGGALMGTMDGLNEAGMRPDMIALEPLQSPLLTTGTGGPHRVEGIGVGFEPPFLDRAACHDILAIDQDRAMETARLLAAQEGILCGPSTGLNVAAAIDLAKERGPSSTIVTFGCDNGSKYMSSDLYK